MEAKSKYDIGSTIYYMNGERPQKDIICGIEFFAGKKHSSHGASQSPVGGEPTITYYVETTTKPINESDAYTTKEGLQASLFINVD